MHVHRGMLAFAVAAVQVDTGGRGVVGLCGPIGRGAMVLATADGYLWLVDPRTGYKPEHGLLAHGGGFAALDAGGDLVGTCGYSNRMGRVSLDTFAKVPCLGGLRQLCGSSMSNQSACTI